MCWCTVTNNQTKGEGNWGWGGGGYFATQVNIDKPCLFISCQVRFTVVPANAQYTDNNCDFHHTRWHNFVYLFPVRWGLLLCRLLHGHAAQNRWNMSFQLHHPPQPGWTLWVVWKGLVLLFGLAVLTIWIQTQTYIYIYLYIILVAINYIFIIYGYFLTANKMFLFVDCKYD